MKTKLNVKDLGRGIIKTESGTLLVFEEHDVLVGYELNVEYKVLDVEYDDLENITSVVIQTAEDIGGE